MGRDQMPTEEELQHEHRQLLLYQHRAIFEVLSYLQRNAHVYFDKQLTHLLLTVDGVHAELAANIGTPDDLSGVIDNGAQN
jgi:hypothetical protein